TEDNWSNVQLHITEDNGDFKGGDYPEAVRKLAADTHVALVDMTEITRKFYEELGVEETAYLHAWSCNNIVSVDNTHTNVWGAYVNAFFVMKAIKELGIAGLSENVIDLANYMPYPAKENYLESNKDYKPVEFNSNLEASKLFKDVEGFKVSAFGDILAPADNKDFSCELEEKDGKPAIRMAVRENRGKISIVTDGILFAFKQIPAATKFKLTADITVNDYFSNDQVSFGLMVRDDVYVDMDAADVLGDYVAAAPLFLTKKENATNCFARRSSEQVLGSKLRREIKKGMTVKACLFATEDGYGASFDDGDVITGGFDFKLTTVDPEHVYLGLFVSRNADVTFSNISLEM
ncbi:carbohydrate esterase family 12 protein, partial [Lachnospira sp.]|uniref:carbohydrate esterase family 12 protein n=1 Tax=Lachnospira sp. TaxID=2049031 RepID=UPI00257C01C9